MITPLKLPSCYIGIMSMVDNTKDLYQSCEISRNFPVNRIPWNFTYKSVSHKSNNLILLRIHESHNQIIANATPFIILVDGSRYEIESVKTTDNQIILKQYFLHYDSKRGQLVRVFVRFVRLGL